MTLLGRCVLVALIAAAPWMLWQLASTGSIVPATIAAKRYYFAESNVSAQIKWIWVAGSFVALLRACGPLMAAAIALPFSAIGRIAIVFTAVLLAAYYCQFPGALTHAQSRYLYILLPFLLFGAASTFRLLQPWPAPRRWMTLFALVAACQTVLLAPFTWREHAGEQNQTRVELAGVAAWCNAHLPKGSRLLIHDAGYISCATHFQMEDLVGLKTPSNIAFHRDLTYPSNGRRRAAAINAAALASHADYLIVLDVWNGIFQITDGLRENGWRLDQVRKEGIYRVYRMTRPSGPFRHKAIRADFGGGSSSLVSVRVNTYKRSHLARGRNACAVREPLSEAVHGIAVGNCEAIPHASSLRRNDALHRSWPHCSPYASPSS